MDRTLHILAGQVVILGKEPRDVEGKRGRERCGAVELDARRPGVNLARPDAGDDVDLTKLVGGAEVNLVRAFDALGNLVAPRGKGSTWLVQGRLAPTEGIG